MNFKCRQSYAFMTFIFLLMHIRCFCYNVKNKKDIELYIKDLTDKFEKDTSDSRFIGIIEPPVSAIGRLRKTILLPKTFLWSPQEQYPAVCMLKCPTHKEDPLKPWKWTNCMDESNGRRPRLPMTFLATFFSFKEFICAVKSEKLTRYMALLRISLTCYPRV